MDELDRRLTTLATHLATEDSELRTELDRRATRLHRRRRTWPAIIASVLILALAVTVVAIRGGGRPDRLRTVAPRPVPVTATGTVLLVDGGYDQVVVNDLDAGTTRTATLPGKVPGDYPYDVLATAGWIVYPADGVRSMRADFSGTPVLLGRANVFVPSARAGWVWLLSAAGGTAPVSVQEVRVDGSESGPVRQLPSRMFARVGMPDGLLVGNGYSWFVWDQATGRLGPRFDDVDGFIDVEGDLLARGIACHPAESYCRTLRVQNLATGTHHDIPTPAGTTGWIPTAGQGSHDVLSSGGRYLAVRAGGVVAAGANHPSTSELYVIDLDTDAVRRVADSKADPFSRVVWSPDGGWVFFETADNATGGYRPADASSRSFSARCCGVALASLPRAPG